MTSRVTSPVCPKRFMVFLPPESDYGRPTGFFYDTPEEAVQHCVRLSPQFFLGTQYYPPIVTIIRDFEQRPGQADNAGYDCIDGAMAENMLADKFIIYKEPGIIPVSFAPWNKNTDNWADRPDKCECGQDDNFCFTGARYPQHVALIKIRGAA